MRNYNLFYDINTDFRRYVDRCCNMYGYTKEEALNLATVKEVAGYYATSAQSTYTQEAEGRTEEMLVKGKNSAGDLGNGIHAC